MVENKLTEDHQVIYSSLINSLPFKVFIKDLNSCFADCNEDFAGFLKLPVEYIIGKTDYDLFPLGLAKKHREIDKKILSGTEVIEFDETYRISDEEINLKVVRKLIKDENGNAIGILGMLMDSANNKKKTRSNKNIFKSTFDGFCVADKTKKITYVNDVLCEMLYCTGEELIDRDIFELEEKNNSSVLPGFIEKAIEQGWANFNTSISGNCGKITPVEINLTISEDVQEYYLFIKDTSKSTLVEYKLNESIQRYRRLAEISPVGIFHTDVNGKTTFVNSRWCEISGMSYEDALGDGWLGVVHPEDRDKLTNNWDISVELCENSVTDYRFLREDGSVVWVMGKAVPETNLDGEIVGYMGTIVDITERKLAEESMRESEKLYREVVEDTSDLIYSVDIKGQFTFANSTALSVSGYSLEELKNLFYYELVLPEYRPKLKEFYLNQIDKKIPTQYLEFPFITRKGEIKWFGQNTNIQYEGTQIVGFHVIARDITERKNAEEALVQEQILLRTLIDNLPDAIYIKDYQGRKTVANLADIHNMGISSEEEVLGKNDFELFPKEIAEKFYKDDQIVLQQGKSILNKEEFLIDPEGKEKWLLTSKVPLRDDKGNIYGLVGIGHDITDIKRTEESIREAESKFTSVFKYSPEAMIITSVKDGKFVEVNDVFIKDTGYKEEEVIGKTVQELKFFIDESDRLKLLDRIQKDHYVYGLEVRLRMKSGTILDCLLSSIIITLNSQPHLLSTILNITDRKRIEEALKESEHFLKESQRVANLGHYTLDISTGKWESSEILNEIFGIDEKYETNIEGWIKILHPDNRDRIKSYLIDKVLTQHQQFDTEYKIIRINDKQERWVHGIGELEFDENGKPIQMIGVIQDITEHKKFEETLASERNLLRTLIDNMPDRIYAKDNEGRFTICNQALATRMGVSDPEDVIGKSDFDLIPRELAKQFRADELEIIQSGQPLINHEESIDDSTGKRRWNLTTKVPLNDNQGNIIGIVGMGREITERKLAEEKLRESEERFRTLYEKSTMGIYRTTPEGEILLANPALLKTLGFSSFDELSYRNLNEDGFEKSDERTQFTETIERYGEIKGFESKWKKQDGTFVYISESARVVRDSNGKTLYYDGVIEDITLRRLAEDKIKQSELEYRTLFENAHDAILVFNPEDEIVLEVNQEACELYGYSKSEFIGMSLEKVTRDLEVGKNKIENILIDGYINDFETIQYTKEGQQIIVEINASVIDFKGKKAILSLNHDITKRKKAEEDALILSKAVVQSPATIIITDEKGNIEYVNPMFTKVTGYSSEEVIGKNPQIFNSGYHTKEFYANLWSIILAGNDFICEMYNKKKNGELYWENVYISPIVNKDGHITNFVAMKEDITEKKNHIEELTIAKEKAEEMNRLKTIFLTNMSHELRTPLIGLLGLSEFLVDEVEGDIKESMHLINDSGQRLLRTLSTILDYSKIEAEKIETITTEISLTNLLQKQIGLFYPLARSKGVEIIEDLLPDDFKIISDEKLLYDIVNNLINNAVKFTSKGTITITALLLDEELLIKVSDTGIGIPQDKLETIFEEFRQVSEGANRSFEGTGLGLSIVKKYLLLLKGRITVESEIGKGSTFTVYLSLNTKYDEKTGSSQSSSNAGENKVIESENNQLKKILLVEDDSISRITIEKMLNNNYNITTSTNGKDAIEQAGKQIYDVILMDINLGRGMDGLQAATEIRKINGYESMPIFAMTAYAMDEEKEEFLKGGCSHYLAKPFTKKLILEVLDTVLVNKDH